MTKRKKKFVSTKWNKKREQKGLSKGKERYEAEGLKKNQLENKDYLEYSNTMLLRAQGAPEALGRFYLLRRKAQKKRVSA